MAMAIIAVGAVVVTGVLGVFLQSASEQRSDHSRAVVQDTTEIALMQDARTAALSESTNFIRFSVLRRDQSLAIIEGSRQELDQALNAARAQALRVEPDGVAVIDALTRAHEQLTAGYDQVIDLIQQGRTQEASALSVALSLDSRSVAFLDDLESAVEGQRADLEAAQAAYQAAENGSDVTVFAIVAIWTGLIVTCLILTFRWIVRPLERLGDVARRVAGGDRTKRAFQDGPAEITALGASINRMADALVDHSAQLERALAAAKERARRDPVTGALNHGAIVEEVKERLARGASPFAVIMADVDGLKETNDLYGHPMGDRVLVAVAAALSQERAVVGRYGGDEFVGLLPHANRRDATTYIETVQTSLNRATLSAESGAQLPVVASLGVAMYPQDAKSVEDLIRISDSAMYRMKRQGPQDPEPGDEAKVA
jgi:diguanylate cyclase (GGDEF)-like protein